MDRKIYDHEYYVKNRDKKIKNAKEWNFKNAEKKKEMHLNWRRKNMEKVKNKANDWRKNNIEKAKKSSRKTNKSYEQIHENKIKRRAKQKAEYNLPLNISCDICQSTENLERHHWDYSRPLLVNTLCKLCHRIQHVKHFEKSIYGGGNSFGRSI